MVKRITFRQTLFNFSGSFFNDIYKMMGEFHIYLIILIPLLIGCEFVEGIRYLFIRIRYHYRHNTYIPSNEYDWCVTSDIKIRHYVPLFELSDEFYLFKNETDFMAFKLRWVQ